MIVLYVDQWHIRWRWWTIWLCGGWREQRRWNLWRLDEDSWTSWKSEWSPHGLKPDFTFSLGVSAFNKCANQLLQQQQKYGVDKRECCLQEIRQTEEKYSETLESVIQVGKWGEHFICILLMQHKFKYLLHAFAALYETSWKVSAATRHWEHLHQHRGMEDKLVLLCVHSSALMYTCAFVSTCVFLL